MKNKGSTTLATLRRWRAMDRRLAGLRMVNGVAKTGGWGLNVPRFAKAWRVSDRTIKRDLAAFGKLGQRMRYSLLYRRADGPFVPQVRAYVWRYAAGQEPLFCSTAKAPSRRVIL
jgi:hypothetical protein